MEVHVENYSDSSLKGFRALLTSGVVLHLSSLTIFRDCRYIYLHNHNLFTYV